MRYLGRRIGHGLSVLFVVSILCFAFAAAAPGSPFDELRLDPQVSPATVEALRERYGLDRSLPEQYLYWLQSVGRGEFGFSAAYSAPVGPLLWRRVRNTLLLTVTAMMLAWLIAVPLGVWMAGRKGGPADRVGAWVTTALLGVPDLLLCLGLLVLAVHTGYLPTGGMASPGWDLNARNAITDVALHLVLPVAALLLVNVPVIVRHVRASVIEALDAPFIQAVRARGVSERRLLFRHALPVAANPLISLLGLSIATLLSASLVVETVMGWPGLGPLLLQAVVARDLHLVVGVVTCSTALLVTGGLVTDFLLYAVDARLRPVKA